jgi:hypothetical protein
MLSLSRRYGYAAMKMLDGIAEGSSSLWAQRAYKGYGMFPAAGERQSTEIPVFSNYSLDEVAMARRVRQNFYERILNAREIPKALQNSPVAMDIQVFSSAWTDRDGVLTIPDDEDTKEELDHTVSVYGHDPEGLRVNTHWPTWGDRGKGFIPFTYLDRHFITAFAILAFDNLCTVPRQQILSRRKVRIRDKKWFQTIFLSPSLCGNLNPHFNMEVYTTGGTLAGWTHFVHHNELDVEIQEIFVLPEYRRKGIGSFMFGEVHSFSSVSRVSSWISAHDLIDEREEQVRSFLISNNYLPFADRSRFADCRYRIEPMKAYL